MTPMTGRPQPTWKLLTKLIAGCFLILLLGACRACTPPLPDRHAVVAPQPADQPSSFSNNPSSAIVPGLPMRYAVAFDDHTNVFDDAGQRRLGSSAMGFAYSDASGDTWRAYRILSPDSETVTLVGSASLAVGEIPPREPRRYPDFPVYYAVTAISGLPLLPGTPRL